MKFQGKLHDTGAASRALAAAAWALALLHGCASVPGETLASREARSAASRGVLEKAREAYPACKTQRIVNTEVLELHPDARVAAERWTVEQCGEKKGYIVSFPPKGNPSGILVRAE
jgi:hypothetical protein